MSTRTIYYINETEDILVNEVELALTRTYDRNFEIYCQVVAANYAMMDIDVANYPVKREIYYTGDK